MKILAVLCVLISSPVAIVGFLAEMVIVAFDAGRRAYQGVLTRSIE